MTIRPRDLFPPLLAAVPVACLAAMAALVLAGHNAWAIVAGIGAVCLGIPFVDWVAGRVFLQADIVLRVMASDGEMRRADLTDYRAADADGLIRGLSKRGAISLCDGNIVLHEDKIGRILAFFIRLRTRPNRSG
jgi:hypothetical protein